jgi:hypothetical protein
MDDICKAVGASAALLLQSDIRTPDVPRTESIDEGTKFYFRNNWHLRDPRARAFPRMMAGEVVTDLDVMTLSRSAPIPCTTRCCFHSDTGGLASASGLMRSMGVDDPTDRPRRRIRGA